MNTATSSKPPRAPGYWYALGGFLLGSVESVAFNVLAAFISPDGYTFAHWLPNLPSLLGAAVWPIALLVSVEVLARVEWETGLGWWLVRVGGIVAVALSSAVISYFHIHDVLVFWKYGRLQAFVGPFVIDGQMLISGFALYTIGRAARVAAGTAQAAVDALPVAPAHPEPARRPNPSSSPGDEPPAVSATSAPPGLVAEAAPPPDRTARPVLRPAAHAPARPKRAARPATSLTKTARPSDDEVIAATRAARNTLTGDLPTETWMRQEFGIGQPRAARLRDAAARPDLHTVKDKEVAVG